MVHQLDKCNINVRNTAFLGRRRRKSHNSMNYGTFTNFICSGERGIRTPGTSQYNGFQDRRDRPLCHLSSASLMRTFPLKALQRYALFSNSKIISKLFSTFFIKGLQQRV